MSTWISKAATLTGLLGLCACQAIGGGNFGASTSPLPVMGGAVTLVGPTNYCPDRESLFETESSAVVLLGKCRAESKSPPAVLSLVIGQIGSAAVLANEGKELADFLTSNGGRASISRSGRAADVRILSAKMSGEAFLVQVEDKAAGRYWRGMIPINGHLVSISAQGPDLSAEASLDLVMATAQSLRRVNARS